MQTKTTTVIADRGVGKTKLVINKIIEAAKQGQTCAYLTDSAPMMREVWSKIEIILDSLIQRNDCMNHTLHLKNGGSVACSQIKNASADRGKSFDIIVCDDSKTATINKEHFENTKSLSIEKHGSTLVIGSADSI